MLCRHVFDKIFSEFRAILLVFSWDFADLPEFRGSTTAQNIRSPAYIYFCFIFC